MGRWLRHDLLHGTGFLWLSVPPRGPARLRLLRRLVSDRAAPLASSPLVRRRHSRSHVRPRCQRARPDMTKAEIWSPASAGEEIVPVERQPWFGRPSRRICPSFRLRTSFRAFARRRVFPGVGRWCCRHRGHRLSGRLLRFFGYLRGLRHLRNIRARTRVEDGLLRKAPRRPYPDGRPVGVGRIRPRDRRPRVVARRGPRHGALNDHPPRRRSPGHFSPMF